MKRNSSLICISVISLFLSTGAFCDISDDPSWHTKKTEHFIIYYHTAPQQYIDEVTDYAERYYNEICEEFGFTRYDSFWTWENRAKIFIYDDTKEYQEMTHQPGWSGAGVDIHSREIKTFINMRHFYTAILPHELTHIIFREFVGRDIQLPLWIDEGVATYMEKDYRGMRTKMVKTILGTKSFIPLEDLNGIRGLSQFISPDVFYAEAASLIEFLLSVYGQEKFGAFCRELKELRSSATWKDAIEDTYGFKNMADMNEKWLEFLKK